MSDWVSHLDEGSGHVYYQNNVTGETTWDKPEGFDDSLAATSSDIPEWSEVMDPGSGHSYYYNNITGESSWDKPAGFDAKKSHDMEAKMEKLSHQKGGIALLPHNLQLLIAARRVQSAYRAKQARKKMREKRADKNAHDAEEKGGVHHKWILQHDKRSGYDYYYNTETHESSWEKPPDFDGDGAMDTEPAVELPKWVKIYDPNSVAYYYFNNFTSECMWEEPLDYVEPPKHSHHLIMNPELKAALCIQNAYRAKQARRVLRQKHGLKDASKAVNGWVTEHDEASGFDYYVHVETGETTWEKPIELGGEKLPIWVKVYDPPSIAYYYFNNVTGEYVWDEPDDYIEPPKGSHHLVMNPELKAALCIQNAYRKKQARKVLRAKAAAAHAAEQIPVDGWVEQLDPHTGEYYYYNVDTGEQTWDTPEALGGEKMPTWVKCYDPPSVSYYYYNNLTGEYVWDEPEDYIEPTKKALASHLTQNPELKAALCIQNAYRKKQARRVLRAKAAAKHAEEQVPVDGWVEQMDPHSGEYFYYNVDTEEQTWDIPEALGGDKLPTWVKIYDSASVSYYYFNNFTGDCVWEEPAGYKEPTKKALASHLTQNPELKAALCIQNAYRKKQARRVLRAKSAAAHASEQVPVDGWIEQLDHHSGQYYYYNVDTQEQTWDIPEALGGEKMPTWVKVYDSASVSYYYFNNFTQECLWEEPKDYVEPTKKAMASHLTMNKELKAALCIQGAYRRKQARRVLRQKQGLHDKKEAVHGWVTEHDKASGSDYYIHVETGEVTWDKPDVLQRKEADLKVKKREVKKTRQVARGLGKEKGQVSDLFMNDKKRKEFNLKLEQIKKDYYKAKDEQDESGKQWVEVYDSGAEDFYYWNQQTGDVQWVKPLHYIVAADDDFLRIVLKLQSIFRGNAGRRKATEKKKGPKAPVKEKQEWEKWIKVDDENSGDTYYYHEETNEVAWERPLNPAEQEAQAAAERKAAEEEVENKAKKADENKAKREKINAKMKDLQSEEELMFEEATQEAKAKAEIRRKRKAEKEKAKEDALKAKAEEFAARKAALAQARIDARDKRVAKKRAKKELHEKNRLAAQERVRAEKEKALEEARLKAEKSKFERMLYRNQRQLERDQIAAKEALKWGEICKILRIKSDAALIRYKNDAKEYAERKLKGQKAIQLSKESFLNKIDAWKMIQEKSYLTIWSACRYPCSEKRLNELWDKSVDSGMKPNDVNKFGETLLHIASRYENELAVSLLISKNVPLNQRCVLGHTALFEAVQSESTTLTEMLLDAGADPLIPDSHGDLPIHAAVRSGQPRIVSKLLSCASKIQMLSTKNSKKLRPFNLVKSMSLSIRLQAHESDVQKFIKEEERRHNAMFVHPEVSSDEEDGDNVNSQTNFSGNRVESMSFDELKDVLKSVDDGASVDDMKHLFAEN